MDTTVPENALTTGDIARRLGTTVPRVHRAVRATAIPHTVDVHGHLRFDEAALARLRDWLGYAPAVHGLSREQVFVLAALSRRPFGLSSARAVARAAGTSPTTASHALRVLTETGYVCQRVDRVAEGRVRDVTVWVVRWGSRPWRGVASTVGRCSPPVRRGHAPRRHLPRRLAHLFWDTDVGMLDTARDGRFVADRVLRGDDAQALAWLTANIAHHDIEHASRGRGLEPARAAYGRTLSRNAM